MANILDSENTFTHIVVVSPYTLSPSGWPDLLYKLPKNFIIALLIDWSNIECRENQYDFTGWQNKEGDILSLVSTIESFNHKCLILINPNLPAWFISRHPEAVANLGPSKKIDRFLRDRESRKISVLDHPIFYSRFSRLIEKISSRFETFKRDTWIGTGIQLNWCTNYLFKSGFNSFEGDSSIYNRSQFQKYLLDKFSGDLKGFNDKCDATFASFDEIELPGDNSSARFHSLYRAYLIEKIEKTERTIFDLFRDSNISGPYFSLAPDIFQSKTLPDEDFRIQVPDISNFKCDIHFWNNFLSQPEETSMLYQLNKSSRAGANFISIISRGLAGFSHLMTKDKSNSSDFLTELNFFSKHTEELQSSDDKIYSSLAQSTPLYSPVSILQIDKSSEELIINSVDKKNAIFQIFFQALGSGLGNLLSMAGYPPAWIGAPEIGRKKNRTSAVFLQSKYIAGLIEGKQERLPISDLFVDPDQAKSFNRNLENFLKEGGIFISQPIYSDRKRKIPEKSFKAKKKTDSEAGDTFSLFVIDSDKTDLARVKKRGRTRHLLHSNLSHIFNLFISPFFKKKYKYETGLNHHTEFSNKFFDTLNFFRENSKAEEEDLFLWNKFGKGKIYYLRSLLGASFGSGQVTSWPPEDLKQRLDGIKTLLKTNNISPLFQTDLNLSFYLRKIGSGDNGGEIRKLFLFIFNPFQEQRGLFSMDLGLFQKSNHFRAKKLFSSIEESKEPETLFTDIEVPVEQKSHSLSIRIRLEQNEIALYTISTA